MRKFLSEKVFGNASSEKRKQFENQYLKNTADNIPIEKKLQNRTSVLEQYENDLKNLSHHRGKRSASYVNANEGWELHYSTTGKPTANKDSVEVFL